MGDRWKNAMQNGKAKAEEDAEEEEETEQKD